MKTLVIQILTLFIVAFFLCNCGVSLHIIVPSDKGPQYAVKNTQPGNQVIDNVCYLIPNPGLCTDTIPRYYYDPTDNKCKEFIYGGCGGIVPVNTMQECVSRCGCSPEAPPLLNWRSQ